MSKNNKIAFINTESCLASQGDKRRFCKCTHLHWKERDKEKWIYNYNEDLKHPVSKKVNNLRSSSWTIFHHSGLKGVERSGWGSKYLSQNSKMNLNLEIKPQFCLRSEHQRSTLYRRCSSIRIYHGFDVEFSCLVWRPNHGSRCHVSKSLP